VEQAGTWNPSPNPVAEGCSTATGHEVHRPAPTAQVTPPRQPYKAAIHDGTQPTRTTQKWTADRPQPLSMKSVVPHLPKQDPQTVDQTLGTQPTSSHTLAPSLNTKVRWPLAACRLHAQPFQNFQRLQHKTGIFRTRQPRTSPPSLPRPSSRSTARVNHTIDTQLTHPA